jgi:uncharacterized phage infection (PIP) family protein YhgE
MPAFFRAVEKIRPVYDWTYKILMFICKLLLIGDIVITAWAVAGRYIPFITDPHWSEEIVLTLMVYMAVLSATLAIRKGAHIRMTAFDTYLPANVIKVSDVLADLAVMALGVVLLIVQVSGGGGSFPLKLLPEFFQNISPFLPITHAVNAMRAAMFGVYMNDFWIEIGTLALFAVPLLVMGLALNGPLSRIVPKLVARIERSKLM